MIFEEIFQLLDAHGVKYLVTGGIAVNLYGRVRTTMDLDLMVDLSDANLKKLVAALNQTGYKPRAPVPLTDLTVPDQRQRWKEEKGAVVFTLIDPGNPLKHLDIFLENPIDFGEAFARRTVFPIGRFRIPVVSLDDLIALKRAAGRPQDLEDIEQLRGVREKQDDR